MAFPGFNRRKRGTISNGDWDRDGVINRKDCEPLNYKRQDGGSNGLTDEEIYEKKWEERRAQAMNERKISEDTDKRNAARVAAKREIKKSPNFKEFRAALRKVR